MDLGLISCTKSKRRHHCKAHEMYSASTLFRKAYSYATKTYDEVAILSAKYGLLLPNEEIEPYDLTLKNMRKEQRQQWSLKVLGQMKQKMELDKVKRVFFHAGKEYREFLIPKLEEIGIKCNSPLEGLSIGKQLSWYNEH